jgi:Family of unknown function (DUF5946)
VVPRAGPGRAFTRCGSVQSYYLSALFLKNLRQVRAIAEQVHRLWRPAPRARRSGSPLHGLFAGLLGLVRRGVSSRILKSRVHAGASPDRRRLRGSASGSSVASGDSICSRTSDALVHDVGAAFMPRLAANKETFTWLEPPQSRYTVNVSHVHAAGSVDEHIRLVRDWAHCAWQHWSVHHQQIRDWLSAKARSSNA